MILETPVKNPKEKADRKIRDRRHYYKDHEKTKRKIRARVKKHYWKDPEKAREYNRKFKEGKTYYYKEPYKDPIKRAKIIARRKLYKERDLEGFFMRARAVKKVNYRVKVGKISKPSKCEKCSKEKRINAHHEDYTKPLEVMWLCYSCHSRLHIERKRLCAA